MSEPLSILGISGSLRQASFNTAVLRAAQELVPDGVELRITDLAGIPVYNQDEKDRAIPEEVSELAVRIRSADAILFSTPEYNYSVPGVLKNAIDWMSRMDPQPFADKPGAIMSASPGIFGGVRAQYDLRKIMVFMNVHFLNVPQVMIGGAGQKFDDEGNLTDQDTRKRVADMLEALRAWTVRLNGGHIK